MVFFAAVMTMCAPATSQEADPWFGPDKGLHFGASAALAGGGYVGGAWVFEEPWQRATVGATLSLSLGVAKELHDLAGYGHPSWRDMTWNAAGTATALGVCWLVDWLWRASVEGRPVSWIPP